MPIYLDRCTTCEREKEDIRHLSAPTPECCGLPMVKVPAAAAMAFVTAGGNLYNWTPAAGRIFKGGGRPRPKVIGKGHGLGGRRPNPSIRAAIAAGAQVNGAPAIKEK